MYVCTYVCPVVLVMIVRDLAMADDDVMMTMEPWCAHATCSHHMCHHVKACWLVCLVLQTELHRCDAAPPTVPATSIPPPFASKCGGAPNTSKLIIKARLHSSIRNSGPVSFAISIDALTTIRAAKILILQKAQKAPGAPEWNAPSSPSFFLLRLNDIVPLLNEDLPVSSLLLYPEMRKISAQEEEEDLDAIDESFGISGDPARTKSAGKSMTQIPLTIIPCSSAVSLAMRSCSQSTRCVLLRESLPPSQLFHSPPLPNEDSLGGVLVGLSSCATLSSVISESGRIYFWGQSMQTSGILDVDQPFPGDQAAAPQVEGMHSPLYELLSLPIPVCGVSCGPSHCLIVTRGGSLWAWGSGTLGQLGFGESIQQQVGPWKLSLPGNVLEAVCGDSHSLALLAETDEGRGSSLYAWGSNERGQLGVGSTEQIITWIPTVVSALDKEGVYSVYACASSSAALASNGRVFLWGNNIVNQCGQAAPTSLFTPTPVPIPGDERCVGVSISRQHSVVLSESGRAFAAGKMLWFSAEADDDSISSSFIPVTPAGCSSDRVFLHAVAGEDCTVLIGDSDDSSSSSQASIFVTGSRPWKSEGLVVSAAQPTKGGVLAFIA